MLKDLGNEYGARTAIVNGEKGDNCEKVFVEVAKGLKAKKQLK